MDGSAAGGRGEAVAFDKYYFEKHVPIAKKMKRLRRYSVNAGAVAAPAGGAAPQLVARLEWDSMAELGAAMESPEGQAAKADLANFASGRATVLVFEERVV